MDTNLTRPRTNRTLTREYFPREYFPGLSKAKIRPKSFSILLITKQLGCCCFFLEISQNWHIFCILFLYQKGNLDGDGKKNPDY